MEITREVYLEAVGKEPRLDDLERCNCTEQGKPGHMQCGWCAKHHKPMFLCGCYMQRFIKEQRDRCD